MLAGSCHDAPATAPLNVSSAISAGLVLSDPHGITDSATDGSAASASALVFISLPDGTANEAVSSTITNFRTAESILTPVTNGGFGPVAITGMNGDTIEVRLLNNANTEIARLLQPVPISRRPVVVRTRPPRGKKDVPLNIRMNVVFSEPIDPASLTLDNVRLVRLSDGSISGLELVSTDPTSIDLVLDAPLAAGAEYRLEISDAIQDLDGDSLDPAVSVDFATDPNGQGGVIAFFKEDGIYVVDSSLRHPTRILRRTVDRHRGVGLTWSPDGQRIAFAAPRFHGPHESGLGIFVMNADGSELTQLTHPAGTADDIQPAWSPDGHSIAFVRFAGNGNSLDPSLVVHLVDTDGRNVRSLGDGESPTWSHDGAEIGFLRGDGFYQMKTDGSSLRLLMREIPVWSPDGARYAFVSDATGNLEIWIANANGTGRRQLTDHGSDDVYPTWSPDGSRIVFSRGDENGWLDLYSMNADGSGVARHSETGSASEMAGAWSRTARLPVNGFVMEALSDELQIDTVLAVRSPLRVRVTENGRPAAGVEVKWTTGAFASPTASVTDSLGEASYLPILEDSTPQHLSIEASAAAMGSPRIFHAFSMAASPARLRFPRNWRSGPLTSAPGYWFEVEVSDAYGNPVSAAVRVDFSVLSGEGSVSPSVDTTEYWPENDVCITTVCAYTYHALGPGSAEQSVVATATELPTRPQLSFSTTRVSAIIRSGGCGGLDDWFEPAELSIAAGSTVGWTLSCSGEVHNVTFDEQPGAPSSSSDGGIYVATFAAPGSYRYRCSLHSTTSTEGEYGVVVVK